MPDALTMPAADAGLKAAVLAARERTLGFLASLAAPEIAPHVHRFSPAHDAAQWPGMLLPGTYNAVHCLALLDALEDEGRAATVAWLERHRRSDGIFRLPGMTDDAVYKRPALADTWAYIDFHVTNYTLGAIEMLAPNRAPELAFAAPYLDLATLDAWLARRDWCDPWQEGNNLVNLASFLLLMVRFGDNDRAARAEAAIAHLLLHLEATQNPATGFWGTDQTSPTGLLHAMAGAMHAFHLWYDLGRPLPHQDAATAYTLTLPADRLISACIDVDIVDLLIHAAPALPDRQAAIEMVLRQKLAALLAAQNPDGGFADIAEGTLRFDGWVSGYAEPQGRSNTFATWFRWIAIAMIAEHLWPRWYPFRFRRMIGIGYARAHQ